MKHFALAAVFAGVLLLAAPAATARKSNAQNIDFDTISCRQFVADIASGSEDDAAAVLLWLDGYLSGLSGDTVLRFDGLEQFASDLVTHCQRRGGDWLLDAAREVGLE